jgi:Ca2+-binding EF-hand superfamily protein
LQVFRAHASDALHDRGAAKRRPKITTARARSGPAKLALLSTVDRQEVSTTRSRLQDRLAMLGYLSQLSAREKSEKRKTSAERQSLCGIPEAVQLAMKSAFERASADESGRVWAPAQLVCALKRLGLRGKTGLEREEIRRCAEGFLEGASEAEPMDLATFAFDVVPATRDKIRELRRDSMKRQFQIFDTDDSGYLSRRECAAMFECLCAWDIDFCSVQEMRAFFDKKVQEVEKAPDCVDYAGFEDLIHEAHENVERALVEMEAHVAETEGLDEATVLTHRDELVSMYDSFMLACGPSKKINLPACHDLLIERGLLTAPRRGDRRMTMRDLLDMGVLRASVDKNNEFITFQKFLHIVSEIRSTTMPQRLEILETMFKNADPKEKGWLHVGKVQALLWEMGLAPRSIEEQAEVSRLMVEADKDSRKEITVLGFQELVLRVVQRFRAAQRYRLRTLLDGMGIPKVAITDFRHQFYAIDSEGSGFVTVPELWTGIGAGVVRLSYTDASELGEAVERVCGVGILDIEEYVRFMCHRWLAGDRGGR